MCEVMDNKVKVVLSDENQTLKEWQETHSGDLPGMIESISQIKQSINDYLTHLVNEEKVCNVKDKTENFDDNNDEQEEVQGDQISGLIKGILCDNENGNRNVKRQTTYSKQVKKIKK